MPLVFKFIHPLYTKMSVYSYSEKSSSMAEMKFFMFIRVKNP